MKLTHGYLEHGLGQSVQLLDVGQLEGADGLDETLPGLLVAGVFVQKSYHFFILLRQKIHVTSEVNPVKLINSYHNFCFQTWPFFN